MINIVFLNSKFSIGQILSNKKNQERPITSSLNEESSNFVGNFNFFFNKELLDHNNLENNNKNINNEFDIKDGTNLNYNFNLSKNLNKVLKNEIEISHKNEKNIFKLNYYEIHDIGNDQSIEAKYKRNFDNNLNLIISGKKNLESSYSENNSIELNYESDCLKIGANLSKTFYKNQDLQSDNNLTLFIMFKPFGQPIAPDITNLINSN